MKEKDFEKRVKALETAIDFVTTKMNVRKIQHCDQYSILGIDGKHNDHPAVRELHAVRETLREMMAETLSAKRETSVRDVTGRIVCIGDIIEYSEKADKSRRESTYYISDGGFPESFGMTDEEFARRYTCKVIGDLDNDSIAVNLEL